MSKNTLVVVDRNAWLHRSIAAEGSADGLEVVACTTARGALSVCCALEPACVVVELALTDRDGLWLVGQIRTQPSEVSATPIIMISSEYLEETRIQVLRGGADVFIPKPFNAVELIAQVRAMLALTARNKLHRASTLPAQPPAHDGHERAIVGDLDHISVATVLTALEQEMRSGHLILAGGLEGRRRLQLTLASGTLIGGLAAGVPLSALEALREALRWSGKRFEFWPSDRIAPPFNAPKIRDLVLMAVRLDEGRIPVEPARGSGMRNKVGSADADSVRGPQDEAPLHTDSARSSITRVKTASSQSGAAWAVARAFEEAQLPAAPSPPTSSAGMTPRPRMAPNRTPSGTLLRPPSSPPSSPGSTAASAAAAARQAEIASKAPLSAPGRRLVETVSPSSRPDPRIDLPERGKLGALVPGRADVASARAFAELDETPTLKIGARRR